MRTLLIFPPFWEPTQPYLSLPALTGYLRSLGHDVHQWDLNLSFHDTLLSAAYLNTMLETRNRELVDQLLDRSQLANRFFPAVDVAKALLKTSEFYQPEAFIQAKATLEKAYQLYSLFYSPSQCSKRAFILPYRESSSDEIALATCDRQANPYLDFFETETLPKIKNLAPNIVGISIADTTQLIPAMTLARLIRDLDPSIHITVGGALFSKFAQALQTKPEPAFGRFFHSMVKGEGEIPLAKLIEALAHNTSLSEVPGLVYRDQAGNVQINDPGLPLAMNSLPPPDFDGLPLDKYWAPEPILPLLGSKDCYWKDCAFCDHYVSYAPRYRLRKPQLIAQDMLFLHQKYGVNQFSFGDETMSPNYARHLAQALVDLKLDLHWSMLSRLQKGFDAETCNLLYQGGCRFIMYGLESANQRVIDLMLKGTDPRQALEVYRETDAAGILNYSFVFFGFPTETQQEAQDTVDFIHENHQVINSLGAGYFYLQKYSPMFKAREKFGIYAVHEDHLQDDWTISVGYETLEGMSQAEASNFHQQFMQQLKDVYGQPLWLVDGARSTIFLYLNHHGKEWLKSYDFSGKVQVVVSPV